MKKITIALIVVSASYVNTTHGSNNASRRSKSDTTERIVKKIVQPFLRKNEIPGASIILYTNNTPYFFHFGYADKHNKTPITQNTLFEIGSISKIFTCLLLAQEILDENMHLNDSINKHIPSLSTRKQLKNVTLKKLATHTSTLPFNAPNHVLSQQDLLNHIKKWKPLPTYSLWYQYSNHGIELLRIALEESTQQKFDQLIFHRILEPLTMNHTGFTVPQTHLLDYASCYDKQGNKAPHWHHPFLQGSAALKSSSSDMLNFLKASIGTPCTPSAIKKAMQLTQTPQVKISNRHQGLGWQINDVALLNSTHRTSKKNIHSNKKIKHIFNGDALIDKTGTTNGFHAYIAVIPNRNIGIVVMINRMLFSGWAKMKHVGREILFKATN
ncbi:MAG: serine hydrolase [Candidatus Babeliales bacterium]|nr:serine hydrolase [Candidatus Babeliales bacterium]